MKQFIIISLFVVSIGGFSWIYAKHEVSVDANNLKAKINFDDRSPASINYAFSKASQRLANNDGIDVPKKDQALPLNNLNNDKWTEDLKRITEISEINQSEAIKIIRDEITNDPLTSANIIKRLSILMTFDQNSTEAASVALESISLRPQNNEISEDEIKKIHAVAFTVFLGLETNSRSALDGTLKALDTESDPKTRAYIAQFFARQFPEEAKSSRLLPEPIPE